MNYFACDSCFKEFKSNQGLKKHSAHAVCIKQKIVDNSLETLKILMFIDNLNLELDITHTRMKKQINLLKNHVLKRNSEYDSEEEEVKN
jgi:hypothetical protein